MKWIACIAVGLVACQVEAQEPQYRVVTFEDRPEGMGDLPVPDTAPIAGLPIGDCMTHPVGDYGGVLWQAGNPATYRNGPLYHGTGGWWVWRTGTVAEAGEHWAAVMDGRDGGGHVAANYGNGRKAGTAWFMVAERLAGLWVYQTGPWGLYLRAGDGSRTESVGAMQRWTWLPVGWDPPEGERLVVYVCIPNVEAGGWVIDDVVLGDDPPDPANLSGTGGVPWTRP